MAAWDFNIEFSGITIVHLSGPKGGKTGKAYLSKGSSGRHKPCLLVPLEGVQEITFGPGKPTDAYGLLTIPVPGGGYLLQVGLEDCTVDFDAGLTPDRTIFYVNNCASEKHGPADWSDASYAMDIARLAKEKGHSEDFLATCSGSVTLPGGRLISVPPPGADRARKEYPICWAMDDGSEKELWKQRAADRLRLTVECDRASANISVRMKGKPDLTLRVGPAETSPAELAITFSSNCAAGTGSANELKEFGALLAPATGFSPKIGGVGPSVTDDHPCFNGLWIS